MHMQEARVRGVAKEVELDTKRLSFLPRICAAIVCSLNTATTLSPLRELSNPDGKEDRAPSRMSPLQSFLSG